ncbi:MAG: type 4b pilus protein PilO2 [Bdellovibrionales bacterium]
MGAGVATVGRRPYAVGLYWENSPSGRVSQAAKEAARQPGQQAEFYAVRAGNKGGRTPQFGLSPSGVGHKAGLPAFAACLANQQPGSWAGAFRLREGTVVTVVRDDLVVPDGDQLYTDEAEARDRLLQEIGFGGLQRIYAPEAWAIPSADTMPVSLLINDITDVRLRPIRIPKLYLALGAAGIAVFIVFLGVTWYLQVEQAREEEARLQHEAELKRLQEQAQSIIPGLGQKKIEYPPPERKWEKKPPPMAVIKACQDAMTQMPVAVAGWRMGEVRCDGSSMSATWQRERGFSAPPKSFIINESGNTATFSLSLPALPVRAPESLVDPVEVTRRYLGQNWPGTIARLPDDPPPPPPPDYKGEWNPPPPPWVKRSFTVTMPVLPWSSPLFFGDLPGTIVDLLRYSQGSGWTVEGVIYENRG